MPNKVGVYGYSSSSFTCTHLNSATLPQISPQRTPPCFVWRPHMSRTANLTCGGWREKHQSNKPQLGLCNRKGSYLHWMQKQAGQNGHSHTGNLLISMR